MVWRRVSSQGSVGISGRRRVVEWSLCLDLVVRLGYALSTMMMLGLVASVVAIVWTGMTVDGLGKGHGTDRYVTCTLVLTLDASICTVCNHFVRDERSAVNWNRVSLSITGQIGSWVHLAAREISDETIVIGRRWNNIAVRFSTDQLTLGWNTREIHNFWGSVDGALFLELSFWNAWLLLIIVRWGWLVAWCNLAKLALTIELPFPLERSSSCHFEL